MLGFRVKVCDIGFSKPKGPKDLIIGLGFRV